MIDLRSDTVTKPSELMLDAMRHAPLGDDVYEDDPTVKKLEQTVAHMLHKDDALFIASGTQSNLIALLSHCQRGDEFIVGKNYHIFEDEAGGAAVLGGLSPFPLDPMPNNQLDPTTIEHSIKPDDIHCPITRLICIENTVHGLPISCDNFSDIAALARRHNLQVHLDGARLMNAATALNVKPHHITQHADSVSLCLSKGLGAPIGSVLTGRNDFIHKARRNRKLLGGGMRQVGVLAACGLVALEHNIKRLHHDHANAAYLSEQLCTIEQQGYPLKVKSERTKTNMVFVNFDNSDGLLSYLGQHNILVNPASSYSNISRLVIHLHVNRHDIDNVIEHITHFYNKHHNQ